MNVLLVSTYELGRQPFGLASPAAWLAARGHGVTCADLSIESPSAETIRDAGLIAFYLPMHTATRLAAIAMENFRRLNPSAHFCCYGLYAALNDAYLRKIGAQTILGGEFEPGLADLAGHLESGETPAPQQEPIVSLKRLNFLVPDRSKLPSLDNYAELRVNGTRKHTGYTESSRGCKHLCRHCPIVPVYRGTFRIVQEEVVLEDIRRQVASGAEHITFGDPDFFNGPAHAMRIVRAMHESFPRLTYDATIKIEHLLKRRDLLPRLKESGCLFVTSAVESVDDVVLEKLDKGHTRADFIEVVEEFRRVGLTLAPTFIPFTPWTTTQSYCELLQVILDLNLVENVAPIQLALRLLIPQRSPLLDLSDVQGVLTGFDEPALLHRWKHANQQVDALAQSALKLAAAGEPRRETFRKLWALVSEDQLPDNFDLMPRATIPYMDEPWYC